MIKNRILLSIFAVLVLILPTQVVGQDDEKKEIPDPESVEIKTKDRVLLQCTYFGGTKGKESIPVLMLHDWGGSRNDLLSIAESIQKNQGCAVLVPDLRGHGESVNTEGGSEKLDPDRWRKAEIASMIADIEACKKFLIEKNNSGDLNIDMLSVVAQGTLSIHTLEWAITDWSFGPLGGIEQGQDVKSIVLLNPEKAFRGLNLTKTIKHPLYVGDADTSLSLMIMANTDDGDKSVRDVKSIFSPMDRMRKENSDEKKFLYFFEYYMNQQNLVVERVDKNGDIHLEKFSDVIGFFIINEAKRFESNNRWATRDRG